MSRRPAGEKTVIRPGKAPQGHLGQMGYGAGGRVYLDSVTGKDGKPLLVVRKMIDDDELRFLQRTTNAPGTEGQTFVPELVAFEKEKPKRRGRKKRPKVQYAALIKVCDLGSLAQQDLADKVASGVISRQAYLAYVFQVISQTNDALAYLHAHGILHCDVKPENIFIMADGSAKLGDLGHGVDCEPGEAVEVAADRMVGVGTPYYMPPESLVDFVSDPTAPMRLNGKADIWSLGVLLGKYIGRDVGLVPEAALAEGTAVTGFFMIGEAAREKTSTMDEWKGQADKALEQLVSYTFRRSREDVYSEAELQCILELVTQVMTAPEESRMAPDELHAVLSRMQLFMPEIDITTNMAADVALNERRITGIGVTDDRCKTLAASASGSDVSMQGTPVLGLATPSPMSVSASPHATPPLPLVSRWKLPKPEELVVPMLMATPPLRPDHRRRSHTRQVSVHDALVMSGAVTPVSLVKREVVMPMGRGVLHRMGSSDFSLRAKLPVTIEARFSSVVDNEVAPLSRGVARAKFKHKHKKGGSRVGGPSAIVQAGVFSRRGGVVSASAKGVADLGICGQRVRLPGLK
ncbi:MAG: protein kinase [Coxiellaceae bacterium]|nr:protein kinase [Coxiellaceae bacterium]